LWPLRGALADYRVRGADGGDPGSLTADNLPLATALAAIPERIAGFGHIKERRMREAAAEQAKLLERYRQPAQSSPAPT